MFDYHLHTTFSADATMPMEAACKRAIELGLTEIAFTEHVDFDKKDIGYAFLDYSAFCNELERLRTQYANALTIVKGVEIGIQSYFLPECLQFLQAKDFDFMIGSVHMVDRTDLSDGSFYVNRTQSEAYQDYLTEVLQAVQTCRFFSVLGHLDLVRRYGDYTDSSLAYSDYSNIIDAILNELAKTNRGMEINTSGFRYLLNSTMPTFEMVRAFREAGGEILTIGSDAHSTNYIADHFRVALDIAKAAGFRYIARFRGLKPEFVPIAKL